MAWQLNSEAGCKISGNWPERDLAELSATEEYVVVTAWVNHIESLAAHKPHQKGILGDSSLNGDTVRKFVVYDSDLKLEKGNLYRIFGRDRTYDKLNEIQIEIQDNDHVDLLSEA